MAAWMDRHPYVLIYLLGCVVVALLLLLKITIVWAMRWLTKTNVLQRNLRKVMPPDEVTTQEKAILTGGAFLVESLLSWINVPIVIWQIASILLQVAREYLQSMPEVVKALRFPLQNNPDLSREAVWAYSTAMRVVTGLEPPGAALLIAWLAEVHDHYPSFDQVAALRHLGSLKVFDSTVISAAISEIDSKHKARVFLDRLDTPARKSGFDESTAVLVEDDASDPGAVLPSRATGTYSGRCQRCTAVFTITLGPDDKTARCPECFHLNDAKAFRPQGTII